MTIATLSPATPSRWGDLSPTPAAAAPQGPKALAPPNGRGHEGWRHSPLVQAIREVLEDERVSATDAAAAAPGVDREGAAGAAGQDGWAQALGDFARALLTALREDRGPRGDTSRGLHLGHVLGRRAWDAAAQRLEQLATELGAGPPAAAPAAPAAPPLTAPPTQVEAAADPAPTNAPSAAPPAGPSAPLAVPLTLSPRLSESPWKPLHDGLIEAFAEVQRSLGRPRPERDESLEARLREMLLALAAKLRTQAVTTAALAPPGSLVSVAA